MKNKQDVSKREKSAAVGLVVCFVAMIIIVGAVTFGQNKSNTETEEQQLAETEENVNDMELSQTTNTDSIQAEIEKNIAEEAKDMVVTPSVSKQQELVFSDADVLAWPIDGNVILSFSMDKTVYFATLDQYKYNPAMLIAGEVEDEVKCSATGEVVSIHSDAKTGTTITMKIGSGYEVVYGQIKNVKVKEGQHVSKGETIGYVSEPTKYFNVEGPNIYFQVLKNGEPVNPLEYLDA